MQRATGTINGSVLKDPHVAVLFLSQWQSYKRSWISYLILMEKAGLFILVQWDDGSSLKDDQHSWPYTPNMAPTLSCRYFEHTPIYCRNIASLRICIVPYFNLPQICSTVILLQYQKGLQVTRRHTIFLAELPCKDVPQSHSSVEHSRLRICR